MLVAGSAPERVEDSIMSKVILIIGASSGFGRLTAEALALSGHTVYASMRETKGRNAVEAKKIAAFSHKHDVNLRAIELDVLSQTSVDRAVAKILAATGRIDVLVHDAGHMGLGPAAARTPQQLSEPYDAYVLGTQRVNRAVLPLMCWQKQGLMIWISSSRAGGISPHVAPCYAAKAGMDAMAVLYARELSQWGIETSIIVPADEERVAECEAGPYAGFGKQGQNAFAKILPPNAGALPVADAIVDVVDMPFGERPFWVHIDPTEDEANLGFTLRNRPRSEILRRVGLSDLFKPIQVFVNGLKTGRHWKSPRHAGSPTLQ
jgi:NAD(P)-dependent dehydrogenase (short-subunit alcohol dehydrogenase family)